MDETDISQVEICKPTFLMSVVDSAPTRTVNPFTLAHPLYPIGLEAWERNSPATRFYEKRGLRRCGEQGDRSGERWTA